MEIKKVEKFEFNGVTYDTENEAKIAAGIVGLGRIISYFSGVGVPDYRQELINLRSKIKAAAEAADILTAKANQPAPEAVQEDAFMGVISAASKIAEQSKARDRKPLVPFTLSGIKEWLRDVAACLEDDSKKEAKSMLKYLVDELNRPEAERNLVLEPYKMLVEYHRDDTGITVEGQKYIQETEEVKNKLEFMALLKIRNCKLEKEYRDLTGVEAKRFEELRKILGV